MANYVVSPRWGTGGRAEVAEPLSKEYTHLPLTRTVWGATPQIHMQMLSTPVGELRAAMHAVELVSPREAGLGIAFVAAAAPH